MPEVSYKQCSLLLECPECSTVNYMDPFSFWNFTGKTKCAGCNTVFAVAYVNGQRVSGPDPAQGPPDKLPGYAQTKDYKTDYTTPDKVSPPLYARPPDQKHGPTYRNVRGNLIIGWEVDAGGLGGEPPSVHHRGEAVHVFGGEAVRVFRLTGKKGAAPELEAAPGQRSWHLD